MANTPSQTGNIGPTLWGLLFIVCIGLVVAHLITAVETEVKPDTSLIERTFISLR